MHPSSRNHTPNTTVISPDSDGYRLNGTKYQNLGIDTFICSGYPHLEESYRAAELVFPELDVEPTQSRAQQHHRRVLDTTLRRALMHGIAN